MKVATIFIPTLLGILSSIKYSEIAGICSLIFFRVKVP
jgi:hypothetical protein